MLRNIQGVKVLSLYFFYSKIKTPNNKYIFVMYKVYEKKEQTETPKLNAFFKL